MHQQTGVSLERMDVSPKRTNDPKAVRCFGIERCIVFCASMLLQAEIGGVEFSLRLRVAHRHKGFTYWEIVPRRRSRLPAAGFHARSHSRSPCIVRIPLACLDDLSAGARAAPGRWGKNILHRHPGADYAPGAPRQSDPATTVGENGRATIEYVSIARIECGLWRVVIGNWPSTGQWSGILVNRRKGIILAGGTGTRLHPITLSQSKQLLPVYDKPMIYYPLATLMSSGIREYMIITTPRDQIAFTQLLGSGEQWGVRFEYAVQAEPNGIAQALLIAERFLDGAPSALILGDNIFYGANLAELLRRASLCDDGATVFGYYVNDPERYGVVQFGAGGEVVDLLEKPVTAPSNYAVTGIYFYDERAPTLTRGIKPSDWGELEITDLNRAYLRAGSLRVERLGRGTAWLDTGTHNSLLDAGVFVRIIEERQGLKVACVEEMAWRMGFIDAGQLRELAVPLQKSGYGEYLLRILRDEHQP